MDDLIEGEVYLVKNKINEKKYVGQALKFVSQKRKKWGTDGRWKSHVREAFSSAKDHCTLLNAAIRKYGVEAFEVTKLCDCSLAEMDTREIEYIIEHNSMVPNGYNLTTGGANGKDTVETRDRKRVSRTGLKHSDETKIGIRLGQRGNRRNKDDINLPDFVCAIRVNGQIIGYKINKFYTNIDLSESVSFQTKTLDCAIDKLEGLKKQYPDVWQLYEEYKQERKYQST